MSNIPLEFEGVRNLGDSSIPTCRNESVTQKIWGGDNDHILHPHDS